MVKLFVADIDGCVAMPYEPYDLEAMQTFADHARRASDLADEGPRPTVSLCSGRPYPYVEAVTQALGLTTPVLFESGSGMFDPVEAQIIWNPQYTDEVDAQVKTVREWMEEQVADSSLMIDHAKRTQAGVIGPRQEDVQAFLPEVESFVAAHAPDLHVYTTHVSIDVLAPAITKREGLQWLAHHLGIETADMAFIGDTGGDRGGLDEVGYSFAPANAEEAVRDQVDVATDGAVLEGTLEAYQWCVAHNKKRHAEML